MKKTIKKLLKMFFEAIDDAKEDPAIFAFGAVFYVFAGTLYLVLFLPFVLPVISIKEWSTSENKTLWTCVKEKNNSFL